MSDAAQPTAAEVRAAAEAVKTALDRHLAAVERRTGEDDPAVYEAFTELAAAAEEYDELLYDRYDEVTPFEIPGTDDTLPPYTGPEEPNALSVLIRRDYAVVEPQRLLAQAQRVEAVEEDGATADAGFLTKAEYVDLAKQMRTATLANLAKLSDADLDRASTGRMAQFAPKLADIFLLVSNHTLMHAGQFSVVRRKLGKPVLF